MYAFLWEFDANASDSWDAIHFFTSDKDKLNKKLDDIMAAGISKHKCEEAPEEEPQPVEPNDDYLWELPIPDDIQPDPEEVENLTNEIEEPDWTKEGEEWKNESN